MRPKRVFVVDGKEATEKAYNAVIAKGKKWRKDHPGQKVQKGQPGYFPSCAIIYVSEPEPEVTE